MGERVGPIEVAPPWLVLRLTLGAPTRSIASVFPTMDLHATRPGQSPMAAA
ncbi:bsl1849 [Bradyrhizobium diazoefficiens USDA 110]|uniref:Bsl1849 protein n=4 Tax=Bradyrhizobium TaxID=374 RepID=Q89TN7_BRADU|nr:hypothetical protein RN69_38740 [Bradyrhizobium japonicum]AND87446.1 hypothetical protein AAV28_06180 [Bradyrhizobium diazoefficiens USDA 110]APO50465.1 hypothetical protein BD122_09465 [Bradyrhizobium diazoefficiens]AWL91560.1 hypothetical protein CIT37_04320 [Bradyrhizobium ottawaense]BAL13222.1 hypothetical protein BJ6T_79760 [Bradyrhizobium japonicum USDA 6]